MNKQKNQGLADEFSKPIVKYGPMTIRINKLKSSLSWAIFLQIVEEMSKTDAVLKEQFTTLFSGGQLTIDRDQFLNLLTKGAASIPTETKLDIQYTLFRELLIKFTPEGIEADFQTVSDQFFGSIDPLFIGELFGRCLVVNFFESWSALQERWNSWTKKDQDSNQQK